MINFDFFNTGVNMQIIPLYGLSAGVLYYNPNLEPNQEDVDPEDMYHQITIMFFALAIHITYWKL